MTEELDGTAVDETEEARAELARVEEQGMMPAVPAAQSLTYAAAIDLGRVLAESGYFKDALSAAQAAVKVMVGSELGFAPMASIMGVHVVEGRPTIGGRLLGAIVKRDPHFDYTIEKLEVKRDEKGAPESGECVIVFTEDGVELTPKAKFTIADADAAALIKRDKAKSNWMSYPTKMLLWRALSWGVDFHCPHLVGGLPLIAAEDAESDADQDGGHGPISRALHPAPDRPPPLSDEKSDELRKRARSAFDELRAINARVFPAARFSNRLTQVEHSHEALETFAQSVEDLRDTEQTIVNASAKLAELADDAPDLIAKAMQKSTRAEVAEAIEAEVNTRLDADAVEGDKGGDDA